VRQELRKLARHVERASEEIPSRHALSCADYTSVIATSDIHSDFPKMLQLMVAARLIELPASLDAYDDRYDVRLITETVWLPTRTLFVICGDLVDGLRPSRPSRPSGPARPSGPSASSTGDVGDEHGSFELRLHCFLFNMRLRAAEKGSAVRFTIGNHDLHTVIRNDGLLGAYVSPSALAFFGDMDVRSATLRPFYACSPYLILSMDSHASGVPEVVFVHGGLRDEQRSLFDEAVRTQRRVDAARASERLRVISDDFDASTERRHVTWQREYAYEQRCRHNADMRERGCELIVVGHCHTRMEQLRPLAAAQCAGEHGCLLVACADELARRESPLIALVDTALSACFHESAEQARARPTQMLLLTKRDGVRDDVRNGARDARDARARTTTFDVGRIYVGPTSALF
jgi:UDP-2,3-diacylglucosamine pyrophosphatase LpxH